MGEAIQTATNNVSAMETGAISIGLEVGIRIVAAFGGVEQGWTLDRLFYGTQPKSPKGKETK